MAYRTCNSVTSPRPDGRQCTATKFLVTIAAASAKPNPAGLGAYGSLTKINAPLGFLRDAVADWERHGEAAISRLRMTDPVRYFLLMVAIETGEFRVQRRRDKRAARAGDQRHL
jgi:hypothetical protein